MFLTKYTYIGFAQGQESISKTVYELISEISRKFILP